MSPVKKSILKRDIQLEKTFLSIISIDKNENIQSKIDPSLLWYFINNYL